MEAPPQEPPLLAVADGAVNEQGAPPEGSGGDTAVEDLDPDGGTGKTLTCEELPPGLPGPVEPQEKADDEEAEAGDYPWDAGQ